MKKYIGTLKEADGLHLRPYRAEDCAAIIKWIQDDRNLAGYFFMNVDTDDNSAFLGFVIVNHEMRGKGYAFLFHSEKWGRYVMEAYR